MEPIRPNLRLAEKTAEQQNASTTNATLDARVLSSLLIKLSVESATMPAPRDAHARLLELTESPAIKALLEAATNLAQAQGLPGESALRQIVSDVLELNGLWKNVLLKEGVTRLTSQYH